MDQENKYIFDIDALEDFESEDKKEARRMKHKKGRVMSWVILLGLVCIFVLVCFVGVSFVVKTLGGKDSPIISNSVSETSVSDEIDDTIDSIIGNEDEVVIAPPEPIVVEPTEEELKEESIRNFVSAMSLEDMVAGIFIVSPEELTGVATVTRAGDGTKTALEEYAVGGILYSSQNMTSTDQFKTVIENTVGYARYPLFLAVDEELGNTGFPKALKPVETMTASKIGETADTSIAYLEEEKIAKFLSELGLNLNLGVVADVLTDAETSVMKDRSFGEDAELVGQLSSKTIAALHEYSVNAAVKFFPGQGNTAQDTTNGLSVTDRSKEEMDACEFVAFKAAIEGGADMVIVSHISAPNLVGDNTQCSQSKFVMTDLLRMEMELDDLVIITDSLSKSAISSYYESGDACITAIKAGADMVLCPEDFKTAYTEVLEAVNKGVIAKERIQDSLVRIYKVKFKEKSSEEINAMILTE